MEIAVAPLPLLPPFPRPLPLFPSSSESGLSRNSASAMYAGTSVTPGEFGEENRLGTKIFRAMSGELCWWMAGSWETNCQEAMLVDGCGPTPSMLTPTVNMEWNPCLGDC